MTLSSLLWASTSPMVDRCRNFFFVCCRLLQKWSLCLWEQLLRSYLVVEGGQAMGPLQEANQVEMVFHQVATSEMLARKQEE